MEEIIDDNNLLQPGTPAWEYAVADGRGTKDALQWRQGDWANRICPVGKDGVNNKAFINLQKYAEDVGVELKTLLGYRGVAFVFEPTLRGVGSSFSIYKALQKYPHLIHQKPRTVKEAMQLVKDEDARLAAEAKARAEEAARVAAEAQERLDAEVGAWAEHDVWLEERKPKTITKTPETVIPLVGMPTEDEIAERFRARTIADLNNVLARTVVLLMEDRKKLNDLKFELEPNELLDLLKYKDKIEQRYNELIDAITQHSTKNLDEEIISFMNKEN